MDYRDARHLSIAALTGVSLRRCESADEPFLFGLYLAEQETRFASVPLTETQHRQLAALQYNAQRGSYSAQFPGTDYDLILVGGMPVGRIWIARLSQEIRIVDIALSPESRGQGIGTLLYRQLMKEAMECGKPLRVTIFRFNEGSLKLHRRLQFRVFDEDEIQLHMEFYTTG